MIATGRSDYPNQINNVLAFPGVFRGALDVRPEDHRGDEARGRRRRSPRSSNRTSSRQTMSSQASSIATSRRRSQKPSLPRPSVTASPVVSGKRQRSPDDTIVPQPIVAVPAFLFVEEFASVLPIGLGFAAGAMVWMVARQLLPKAFAQASHRTVLLDGVLAFLLMLALQLKLSS